MYLIRPYTQEDYKMIKSWWIDAKEIPPTREMLPESTTLILEVENTPAYCLSIYFTNCKEYAYLGNFISDRKVKLHDRKLASQTLMDAVVAFAQALEYKNVICMTGVDKLKERYKDMGFTPTISNVQTFVKRTN